MTSDNNGSNKESHADEEVVTKSPKTDCVAEPILWPIFVFEIICFVLLLPIFALAGMGYSPSPTWRNYLLMGFHLYPVYIVVAIFLAAILKAYDKYVASYVVALAPPFISAFAFCLFFIPVETISKKDRQEANIFFHDKCKIANGKVYKIVKDEVESIFVESSGGSGVSGVDDNGKYASEGSAGDFYGAVNGGFLNFYEKKNEGLGKDKGYNFRREFYEAGMQDNLVDGLLSKYGVRYVDLADGVVNYVRGGRIEIFTVEKNELIAESTFFVNRLSKEYCGEVDNGRGVDAFALAQRVLNLQYQKYR